MTTCESTLSIARRFGVSEAAVRRHRKTMRADLKPVSPQDQSAETPAPAALTRRAVMEITPSPPTSDDALFDVRSLAYPWAPGEQRPDQKHAVRLRNVQRYSAGGIADVKTEALALVVDWLGMQARVSPSSFARMVDVPVSVVMQWQEIARGGQRHSLLHTDPTDRVAGDVAEYDKEIARVNMLLSDPSLKDKGRVTLGLLTQKTKLMNDRAKLLDRHGLSQLKVAPPEDDATRQARLLREDIDALVTKVIEGNEILEKTGFFEFPADERTPEQRYQDQVQCRLDCMKRYPEWGPLPEVDPEDICAWSPGVQAARRATARQRADGFTGSYNRPGDEDPIPGWPIMPKVTKLGPVIEHLRALRAAENPEPEPEEPDEAA